jgi:hypothetical protein
MFASTEFLGDSSAHANSKASKKSFVVKERTFLETMRLCLAKSTDGRFSRIVWVKLTNDSFVVSIVVSSRCQGVRHYVCFTYNFANLTIVRSAIGSRWTIVRIPMRRGYSRRAIRRGASADFKGLSEEAR